MMANRTAVACLGLTHSRRIILSVRTSSTEIIHQVRYSTGTKKGSAPPGPRSAIKVKINKKDGEAGKPTAIGPDPGRLVNPEFLDKKPIDLSSITELESTHLKSSQIGNLFKFTPRTLKVLEQFNIPSSIQSDWKPTPLPTTTIRQASVDLVSRLNSSKTSGTRESPLLVLTGQEGSGKSTVLLHAVTFATQQRWIVLYIPDVQPLVDGRYAYEYCSKSKLYHQNNLSADLLRKLISVNDLNGITITTPRTLFGTYEDRGVESNEPVPVGEPLSKLIENGIKNIQFAPIILDIALEEISKQSNRPVLIAIDGAQNLFKPSGYVDGSNRAIDSFGLNVPRLLVEIARGNRTVSKGLCVLSSSSLDSQTKSIAWDLIIKEDRLPSGMIWSGWKSYGKLIEPIKSIPKLEIKKLDRLEAVGIARGLKITRQFFGHLSDKILIRHLVVSNGNVREFRREIKHQMSF